MFSTVSYNLSMITITVKEKIIAGDTLKIQPSYLVPGKTFTSSPKVNTSPNVIGKKKNYSCTGNLTLIPAILVRRFNHQPLTADMHG